MRIGITKAEKILLNLLIEEKVKVAALTNEIDNLTEMELDEKTIGILGLYRKGLIYFTQDTNLNQIEVVS